MVSRLKVGQLGEFMGSPCAFGAPRAHVEVLFVLGFPPTLVSCYSAVKMYLTLFWGLVFVDKHSHCGSLQSQSLRNSFSSVLQFL